MARSAENFTILTLEKAKNGCKSNKINENINKLRNMHRYFVSQKAYFFPVSLFFSKSLILPPPRGRLRPEYSPLYFFMLLLQFLAIRVNVLPQLHPVFSFVLRIRQMVRAVKQQIRIKMPRSGNLLHFYQFDAY